MLEGYWDDDFSRARNEALAACTGDWIAWLDADETLRCPDVPALRASLARTGPEVDGFSVVIENTTGAGVGSMFVHSACRLFRRSRCEWAGRLHEQVAGRGTHRPVTTTALTDTVRIHHTGYTAEAMTSRGKAERNLRVAEAEVERSEGWDKGFSLTSLGRSYMTAGKPEEALDYCRRGAESTTNMITRRLAYRTIVDALVALGRFDDALVALDDLRQISDKTVLVQVLEANIARQQGRHEDALALFEVVDQSQFDDDGFEYDATMFAQQRAESLSALGRSGEAADALLHVLADRGVLDSHLGTVVEYLDRAGRSLEDLALALPSDQLPQFLAQVLQLREDVADRVLEACLEHRPADNLPVLATAATLARRLPLERALQWSSRLRACGLDSSCPLVFIATDSQRGTVERARAVGAGFKLFGDPRLPACFGDILRAASDDERAVIVGRSGRPVPGVARGAGPGALGRHPLTPVTHRHRRTSPPCADADADAPQRRDRPVAPTRSGEGPAGSVGTGAAGQREQAFGGDGGRSLPGEVRDDAPAPRLSQAVEDRRIVDDAAEDLAEGVGVGFGPPVADRRRADVGQLDRGHGGRDQ